MLTGAGRSAGRIAKGQGTALKRGGLAEAKSKGIVRKPLQPRQPPQLPQHPQPPQEPPQSPQHLSEDGTESEAQEVEPDLTSVNEEEVPEEQPETKPEAIRCQIRVLDARQRPGHQAEEILFRPGRLILRRDLINRIQELPYQFGMDADREEIFIQWPKAKHFTRLSTQEMLQDYLTAVSTSRPEFFLGHTAEEPPPPTAKAKMKAKAPAASKAAASALLELQQPQEHGLNSSMLSQLSHERGGRPIVRGPTSR